MQPQPRSARLLLLASLAAGACAEQTPPTAIPDGVNAEVVAAAKNPRVKVKILQLGSNTLRIDGPSVSGNVSIGNSGVPLSGAVVRAVITQGGVSREAVNAPTQCSPAPDATGELPSGTCDMAFTALASNSAPGSGSLVPGSATFTLRVIQTSDAGDTELASKSLDVNLVGTPSMTVTIDPTAVLIDGPAATATAVIQNPANGLQGVLLQGWIVQGVAPNQARRAAGGSLVTCAANAGVLPPGTCTMTISVTASNTGSGTGLLASGPATFELELIQSTGSVNTTLDVKTVPVTLVGSEPQVTRVELQSTTLVIGGPEVPYTVDIQNGGAPRSNVVLIAQIHQFTNGHVVKQADGLAVTCGGAPGDLPTTGTGVCTIQSGVHASDDANGGALTPGAAVLFVDLFDVGAGVMLDRERVDITLETQATIIGITIPPTLVLGSVTGYEALLQNTGPALQNVVLRNSISQGTARRAAGERTVQCPGGPVGELPNGSCEVPANVVAMNAPAEGTGTLLPGLATLEIRLEQQSGGTTTTLDVTSFEVTLVMTAPGIIGIELSAPNVLIGEQIEYTATLYNPTSETILSAGIQGYLSQGSIVDFGTGGTELTCAGAEQAQLPPGVCEVTFTLNTRNLFETPEWSPGAATFRLELIAGTTVLDSKSLTVFLNIIQ